MKATRIRTAHKVSLNTMTANTRKHLMAYIEKNGITPRKTVEQTKTLIQSLPKFESGCFTYLQATAIANYLHKA